MLTFVIETIDSVDTCTLVVTAEDEKVFWVLDLVREQEAYCLERLLASIDVIAKEQVVRFWWEASVLEQSEEIVILPVDVTLWTHKLLRMCRRRKDSTTHRIS